MYIQSNDSVNMRGVKKNNNILNRIRQKLLDSMPLKTIDDAGKVERWKKYDDNLSHPAKNRLIMGATALVTQPTIDYFNRSVDEDTRKVSRNRTLAKIIVGTLVGIGVRGSCFELVKNMTDIKGKKKLSRFLLPPKEFANLVKNEKYLKNYRNALSTFIALLVMTVTNFAIDAPLTLLLTNYFNQKQNLTTQKNNERMA